MSDNKYNNNYKLSLDAILAQEIIKIELGGGQNPTSGYINVDETDINEVHYVTNGLGQLEEFPESSIHGMLCKDIICRFHRGEVIDILRKWRSILKWGSKLILHTPDLDQIIAKFPDSCDCWINKQADPGCPKCKGLATIHKSKLLFYMYGKQGRYYHYCYDENELRFILENKVGFVVREVVKRDFRLIFDIRKERKEEPPEREV